MISSLNIDYTEKDEETGRIVADFRININATSSDGFSHEFIREMAEYSCKVASNAIKTTNDIEMF